jgi:hypothetical protein
MENLKQVTQKKVSMDQIGLYLRVIVMDYGILSNREYAKKITENFGVDCEESDVDDYHQLSIVSEDYELESRKQEFKI